MNPLVDIAARGTRGLLEVLDRPVELRDLRRRRGVALVVALVTITVLAAAITQYAYSSRVNLKMAVNAKDKVKSYFLARSAVNLSHLMVNFQYSLKSAASKARGNESAQSGACNPAMISVAMRRSNFQIYQYMDLLMRPFNSGSLETPVGGIDLQQAGVQGFGKVQGEFDVEIEPESGKLNVNRFAKKKIQAQDVQEFCALVTDNPYAGAVGEQDDFGGEPESDEVSDYRILRYIIDFIDLDETEIPLTKECTIEQGGSGGSESSRYADFDVDIEPRNAKLTHTAEIFQVYGVDEEFMRGYGEELTVYPVGKPNVNMAEFPIFFSVLCRNARIQSNANVSNSAEGFTLCQKSPRLARQVMYFALALDGVRAFFKDPISVLMAYVGSTQSRLLPSAKKGQPVAFLRSSQVHSYLEDFKKNKQLMAQFMQFSPAYRKITSNSQDFGVSRVSPNLPDWSIAFNRTGIIRSVSTSNPKIFRIKAKGKYGSTQTSIETVVDFSKPIRKLPNKRTLPGLQGDSERAEELKQAVKRRRKSMPRGRILYWREGLIGEDPLEEESGESAPGASAFKQKGARGGADAGVAAPNGSAPGESPPSGGATPEGPGLGGGTEGGSEPGAGTDEWDFDFGN